MEICPDLVMLDIRLPDANGLDVLKKIKAEPRNTVFLVMTAYDDMKTTVEAIKFGAFEYLVKPLNFLELDLTIEKAFQVRALEDKVSYLVEEKQKEYTIDNLVGHSSRMREVFKMIGSVATTRTNILIQGESGTGKELVAKAIHYNSSFRDEPFIVINCSAIQDTLLESELFGHDRGAFTDAVSETRGKFEIAGRGTLFLDEVGDVSPNLQSKLLRVIETRDFMKVGGEKVLKTEARIIAATNQNLTALIEKGRFREDLFYRLKVVEIHLPPLRERKDDIPDLVAYLLEKINRELAQERQEGATGCHEAPDGDALEGKRPGVGERPDPGRHPGQGRRHPQGEPAHRAVREKDVQPGPRLAQGCRKKLHPACSRRHPRQQDEDEPDPPDQPSDPRQEDQGIRAGRSAPVNLFALRVNASALISGPSRVGRDLFSLMPRRP